jgi:hypothetical protein
MMRWSRNKTHNNAVHSSIWIGTMLAMFNNLNRSGSKTGRFAPAYENELQVPSAKEASRLEGGGKRVPAARDADLTRRTIGARATEHGVLPVNDAKYVPRMGGNDPQQVAGPHRFQVKLVLGQGGLPGDKGFPIFRHKNALRAR